jgi:hypothetical protein
MSGHTVIGLLKIKDKEQQELNSTLLTGEE